MADRFDKFTGGARRALTLAQEEAQRFNHNYIGTEHLLLGLIREKEGVAARVFASFGLEVPKIRSAVEFIIGRGEKAPSGEIGLTPRAKKVIELAVEEARRLNHSYIGTEHLLLGMVREGEGIAFGVLQSLGVSLDGVRTETARVLTSSSPGAHPVLLPPSRRQMMTGQTPAEMKAAAIEEARVALEALQRAKLQAISAMEYEFAAELRSQEMILEDHIEAMSGDWQMIIGERPEPRELGRKPQRVAPNTPNRESAVAAVNEALAGVDDLLLQLRTTSAPDYLVQLIQTFLRESLRSLKQLLETTTESYQELTAFSAEARRLTHQVFQGAEAVRTDHTATSDKMRAAAMACLLALA